MKCTWNVQTVFVVLVTILSMSQLGCDKEKGDKAKIPDKIKQDVTQKVELSLLETRPAP